MKEQLISYETAVLAKEKNFDWECNDAYVDYRPFEDVYEQPINYQTPQNHNNKEHRCSIPTQSVLQKWLREVHKIEVNAFAAYNSIIEKIYLREEILKIPFLGKEEYARYICIVNDNRDSAPDDDIDDYICFHDTYEECLELGLQEALKLIK